MPRGGPLSVLARRPVLGALAAGLLVLLLHLPSLDNGFHYDDGHSLLRNAHVRSLSHIPGFFADAGTFSAEPRFAMYRPLVVTSLALDYAWAGYRPLPFHVTNLLIHVAATLLAGVVLLQLGFAPPASAVGAMAFGLHPAQTEVVNYVSSRSESLAGLLCLAAMAAYLRGTRAAGRAAVPWQAASLLAFAAALLCKATALALPVGLALHQVLRPAGGRRASALRRHLPYWAVAAAYVAAYGLLSGAGIQRAAAVRPWQAQLATQGKALVHYLHRAGMPVGLSVYPQFWESPSPADAVPLAGLALAASVAWLLWRARRAPGLCFAAGWFAVMLAPALAIPLHVLVNDHRLYLSLFAMAVATAWVWTHARGTTVVVAALVVLAVLSVERDRVWRDEVSLWTDAAARSPRVPEAQYNLGHALQAAGSYEAARAAYERAVAASPAYPEALANLGVLYRQAGDLERAQHVLRTALASQPDLTEALNTLGLVYRDTGRLQEAAQVLEEALQRDPDLAEAHYNLGLVYRDAGKMELAFEHLRRALELKPELKSAYPPQPAPAPGR